MNTANTMWVSTLSTVHGMTQQGTAVGVPGATAAPSTAAPAATGAATTGTSSSPLPAQPVGAGGAFGQMGMLIPMVVVLVGMVVFQIWQGKKQAKQREELFKSVKKGDRVSMTSGVIGTIQELTETEVVLRVEEGRIRFRRDALVGVVNSTRELADSKVEVKPTSTVSV